MGGIVLSEDEKRLFTTWVKYHLATHKVVPGDEGNEGALLYNIIHNIIDGEEFEPYNYLTEQDQEIESYEVK